MDGQVEDVTAELVGPEHVRGVGRVEREAGRRCDVLEGSHEDAGKCGNEREEPEDDHADEAVGPPEEPSREARGSPDSGETPNGGCCRLRGRGSGHAWTRGSRSP